MGIFIVQFSGKNNGTGNLSADLTTWLSGALGNQDTCIEGFEGTNRIVQNLVAGGLNQVTSLIKDILTNVDPPNTKGHSVNNNGGGHPQQGRKLIHKRDAHSYPHWFRHEDRKMLQVNGVSANVVVAKDGTGNFTNVTDAISAAPDESTSRFVIYIKKGVYNEYIEISKKKWNLMMIGDGMDVTVISGNRSFIDGWTTYRSATFGMNQSCFLPFFLLFL